MKKVIFISALAIAAAVSCTKSDIVDTKFNEAISFETYTGRDAMTKATPYGQNDLPSTVGLYGFYTGAGVWESTTTANLWANEKLSKGTDGKWTYSTTKYWTNAEDKYTFLAYAPYAENNGLVAVSGNNVADPTVTYTVPTDLADQQDVLYANQKADANGANGHVDMVKPANNGDVDLKFKHALSRVTVKAKDNEASDKDLFMFDVKEITISGDFMTKGTLKLSNNTWTAAEGDKASETYVFYSDFATVEGEVTYPAYVAGRELPKTYKDYSGTTTTTTGETTTTNYGDNYLMIIPTDFSTVPAVLTVKYTTIYEGSESNLITKTFNVSTKFEQGKAYAFELDFANNVTPITFSVSVEDWAPETSINTGNPENSTNWN